MFNSLRPGVDEQPSGVPDGFGGRSRRRADRAAADRPGLTADTTRSAPVIGSSL
jgi:hypothetical protein